MKNLNITKARFENSRYFQTKYGTLKYVSESGNIYKTDKGNVLKFVNEAGGLGGFTPNELEDELEDELYDGDDSDVPNHVKSSALDEKRFEEVEKFVRFLNSKIKSGDSKRFVSAAANHLYNDDSDTKDDGKIMCSVTMGATHLDTDSDDIDEALTDESIIPEFEQLAREYGNGIEVVGWNYRYEQYHNQDSWRHAKKYRSDSIPVTIEFTMDMSNLKVKHSDIRNAHHKHLTSY